MSDELMPCPFCGNSDHIRTSSPCGVSIECCICGSKGPIKENKQESKTGWNTRKEREAISVNAEHQKKIRHQIYEALERIGLGPDDAMEVMEAIVDGKIKHVSIQS